MGLAFSIIFFGTGCIVAYLLHKHENRGLKTGFVAVTEAHTSHPSWNVVVDNYVYIHNAFPNDLQYIIRQCKRNSNDVKERLEAWAEILDLHSRVELKMNYSSQHCVHDFLAIRIYPKNF